MRNYLIRSLEAAVCIACLAVASCVMSADSAAAQGQATSPAVKQIALTKTQIEGVIAAQKEMDEINEKVSEKPRPYLIVAEQFESAAKKNGFASYDEYTNVIENISIVLAGFDPTTKNISEARPSLKRRSRKSKPTSRCHPRIKR